MGSENATAGSTRMPQSALFAPQACARTRAFHADIVFFAMAPIPMQQRTAGTAEGQERGGVASVVRQLGARTGKCPSVQTRSVTVLRITGGDAIIHRNARFVTKL